MGYGPTGLAGVAAVEKAAVIGIRVLDPGHGAGQGRIGRVVDPDLVVRSYRQGRTQDGEVRRAGGDLVVGQRRRRTEQRDDGVGPARHGLACGARVRGGHAVTGHEAGQGAREAGIGVAVDLARRVGSHRCRPPRDRKGLRPAAARMVRVSRKRGAGRCRSGVHVVRVADGERLAETAGAGHGSGAGRLGGAVVDDARRTGDDGRRRGGRDREGRRAVVAGVVGIARIRRARGGCSRLRVVRVTDGQRLAEAAGAGRGRGAGCLGGAVVHHAGRAGDDGRGRCGIDDERRRAGAAAVVRVARIRRAGAGRSRVHVVRIRHRERLVEAAGAGDRRRARHQGRARVDDAGRAGRRPSSTPRA